MPSESTDSSLSNHSSPPEAAALPPRTPTGRLQPASAFRPAPAATHRGPVSSSVAQSDAPTGSAPHPEAEPQSSLLNETDSIAVAAMDQSAISPEPAAAQADAANSDPSSGRRSRRSSQGSPSRRSPSTRVHRRGTPRARSLDAAGMGELAALDAEADSPPGSSLRELSGLLLAFALSVALTQASLWWVVGVDPLGAAPAISQWVPGIVPPGLRP